MKQTRYYNAKWVSAYYDEYADKEWERFDRSPADMVNLHIHSHYLRHFVKPKSKVLEIGAGPGRFTQILAELGCRVLVTDISQVQLALNEKYAKQHGFENAVEERLQLDVCDMSRLSSESFDSVVCYGGPLSYVFEKAEKALGECVRTCKCGGYVLASVMSLWGGCHRYLEGVLEVPPENNRRITDSGNLAPENLEGATHFCHMFRAKELYGLAERKRLTVLAMSASNCLSLRADNFLAAAKQDETKWSELLRMEIEAGREEGCLDMGTHIIMVGEKQ